MSGGALSFWDSWLFWRDALAVAVLAAAMLSYLGVWVMLRRVVFVPLALSGVSSLGVVLAFGAEELLSSQAAGPGPLAGVFDPFAVSLLASLAASAYFARAGRSSDQAVVVAYLLASAATLLLGRFVRSDLHDLQAVLFGNAVLVEPQQVLLVAVAVLAVGGLHALLHRRFLFVSFDPAAAGALRLPVAVTELLLYASFAIGISAATRALGALPAFGLTVLPGLTGLRLGRSLGMAFGIAVPAGVLAATLGYYLAFSWELPTGAAMVGVAGLVYLGSMGVPRAR